MTNFLKNAGRCFGEFKNSTSSSSLTFTQSSSFFIPIISTDTIDMTSVMLQSLHKINNFKNDLRKYVTHKNQLKLV